jgi:hypothetical protein
MIRSRQHTIGLGFIAAALLILLAITGCATPYSGSSEGSGGSTYDRKSAPLYLDFGDVLIPRELTVNKEQSFVFKTMGLTAGVISLDGSVDVASLISFFENNLTKDNWRLVSSFKSVRSILMFQKDSRWCVINISEKQFKTYVEVWVAPTNEGQQGSGGGGSRSGGSLFQ